MAVIFSETSINLDATNGFTRTLSDNIATFSTTELSLSSARQIAFTPSAAENCKGVVICLTDTGNAAANKRNVLVELQENVASVWTTRASKTLTAAQILNSITTSNASGVWIRYFEFTTPYAVTAAASTWRINISNSGGSNDWSIRTSDATNISHVVVGSTNVTYTDNTDQIIVYGAVTLNANFTLKGKLGTGETTRSVCGWTCTTNDATPANVANLRWTTSSSITGNLDGLLVIGAHSGFRAGTEASPISVANQGTLNVLAATSGTNTNSGFSSAFYGGATTRSSRGSIFIYGEIPTVEDAIIASDASVGSSSIITTTSTGWVNNDRIFIGGKDVRSMGDFTTYTVTSTSGTTVNISPNIATNVRKANGRVIRLNGYGFRLLGTSSITLGLTIMSLGGMSNLIFSGVQVQNLWIQGLSGGQQTSEEANYRSNFLLNHMSIEGLANSSMTVFWSMQVDVNPTLIDHVNNCKMSVCSIVNGGGGNSNFVISNCISLTPGPINGSAYSFSHTGQSPVIDNCVFENSNAFLVTYNGSFGGVRNCRFYGCATGAVRYNTALGLTNYNNTYDNCVSGMQLGGVVTGSEKDSIWGSSQANTNDVECIAGVGADFEIISPTGNITVTNAAASFLPGSYLKISDYNNTINDDRGILKIGNYQRTGTGLSDTISRSGHAIRLAPSSTTYLLNWPNNPLDRIIYTGDIEDIEITVSCWVYINNTAYDAGTHTMPTLNVKYDNATTITDVATATFGSWQELSLTFTPTTDYSQIEVWVSGNTDATTTNAYFYIDDLTVSGVPNIDFTNQDSWIHASPIWPPLEIETSGGGETSTVF